MSITYDTWFRCDSCGRLTASALCGCPKPNPIGPLKLTQASGNAIPVGWPIHDGAITDLVPKPPKK